MPRSRNQQELLAGKLISAIQNVWSQQTGEPQASASEEVMNASHSLLQAAKNGELTSMLAGCPITEYLGAEWFAANPAALPYALALQKSVNSASGPAQG
jgi:hypothetical protein